MKVSTQVEVSDTKLLEAIAKEFLVEIGLVHEIHNNGYCSRYEIGRDAKPLLHKNAVDYHTTFKIELEVEDE